MKLNPVSIVIPTKNRARFLPNLIESVLKLDYEEFEIIVVDDFSSDNTNEILNTYPIKVISLDKPVGSAEARNLGIQSAKFNIIALTDSDCIVTKTWLRDLVPYLENFDVVSGRVIYKNKAEMKLNPLQWKEKTIITKDSKINYLNTNNMIFKKELWSSSGGFLKFRLEDLEFSWRVLKKGFKLIFIPQGLIYHYDNRNPLQNTIKYLKYGKSYAEIASIHKLALIAKPEPFFDKTLIKGAILLFIIPFICCFLLSFAVYNDLNHNFLIVWSFMIFILSGVLIYKILRKIDVFYKIYKFCFTFMIVIYTLIYLLKKKNLEI